MEQKKTLSTFSNYSRKPSLKKSTVQNAIFSSLRNRIISQICTQAPALEQIYNDPNDTPSGKLVNEGVELAKQGRWKLASDKWENAISKEKSNPLAHHNMGIYHEHMGQIEKALPHYEKIKNNEKSKLILKPRKDAFLKKYQIPNFEKPLLPQISFISAGNWVYVAANDQKLKLRKKYSVYRIEMNRKEDDQSVTGTHIREVGVVRLMRKEGNYYQGRIRQSIVDYPILPGDFLVN